MDSANSGSLQSSSGAEEECDSRAALHDSKQITTHHLPHQQPSPLFNNRTYHHDQTNNNVNPFFFSSSPQHHLLNLHSVIWSNTLPSFSDHLSTTIITTPSNPLPPTRNPKKRSRASRRAPTTVLATDTNNFRAMVQEFTGIPSPSPSTPATSLDLFRRSNLTAPPSYLLPHYSSPSLSSFIDSCNLLNTMQNPLNFPYNNSSLNNHSPLLNLKSAENLNCSNGFGAIGQTHKITLPDLLSTAATPTATSSRNEDLVASGNWDNDGKESSGMKGDQGFIEPWTGSCD